VEQAVKALKLSVMYPAVFTAASIYPDIRPIFWKKRMQLTGLMMKHQMRLTYLENDTQKEVYISFDSSELEILRCWNDR